MYTRPPLPAGGASIHTIALAFITVLVVVGAALVYLMIREWRASHHEPPVRELPPLVIPLHGGPTVIRSPGPPRAATTPPAATVVQRSSFERPELVRTEPSPMETVRFRRPADEALQLLPGRLEVLAGEPRHQEIRFVRVPGERPQLILGRDPGSSPQHVALQSRTVSRRHARLAYSNGAWAVANLSSTNPLVVNDEAIGTNDERRLADGDRIELGEVVLRFHAR